MHRLSNVDTQAKTADCLECGPGVRVRYRKHRQQWACAIKQAQRTPGYWRRHTARGVAYQRARRSYRYGMTPAELQSLLLSQDGVCAICRHANPDGVALAIDHCHETGRVRGLLCSACNLGLGLMRDDPERMLRAVAYLTIT